MNNFEISRFESPKICSSYDITYLSLEERGKQANGSGSEG